VGTVILLKESKVLYVFITESQYVWILYIQSKSYSGGTGHLCDIPASLEIFVAFFQDMAKPITSSISISYKLTSVQIKKWENIYKCMPYAVYYLLNEWFNPWRDDYVEARNIKA